MTDERPTPETDAAKCKFTSLFGDDEDAYWVPLKLARCLERERDSERALADRLAELVQRDRDQYGGQLIDSDCDCSDCEYLEPIDAALAAWKKARNKI